MDQRAQLPRLAPATLVIAGKYDVSTPPERAREIVAAAPNARYVELDAAHLANVERPVSFTQAVSSFLESG
jgi:3-oxoadipate enol-lactonase